MNLNRTLLIMLLVLSVRFVSAQEFLTHGASPDLHLIHPVVSKETWFSIGRKYNLTPKEIAAFNNTSVEKPLEVGQAVKIPLTKANFSQADPTGSVDDLVPVYHVVQEKEWMYRVSVNHNKVPIEKLERWNSISRNDVKAGTKLIVGFLTAREAVPARQTTASAKPVTPQVPQQKAPGTQTAATKSENAPIVTEGGYFKTQYDNNGKNQAGISGIFKSTSGWNDGKYYALMNNVTVGTIVKVNLPATNKSIYAKVLGELPDMKESAGLSLRISDAAAKELGAATSKFNVEVMY
jgi:LysM repeat protein